MPNTKDCVVKNTALPKRKILIQQTPLAGKLLDYRESVSLAELHPELAGTKTLKRKS